MIPTQTGAIAEPDTVRLADSIHLALNDLLRMRRGESLLVYIDSGSDHRLAEALRDRAAERGRAELFRITRTSFADQASELAARISRGAFDVICELSERYFYRTHAWQVARERGTRAFSLAGLDTEAFIRCVGGVDHQRMFDLGSRLRAVLQRARDIRIHTNRGTDLRMELALGPAARLTAYLRNTQVAYVAQPSGRFDRKTRATFLGGQLAFRGIPASINGTAIIDGCVWPPSEIGRLEEPLIVTIRGGAVVGIAGCSTKSTILSRWFERERRGPRVEHICLGFHPAASLSGSILEAERVFGCISIGMGAGAAHTDGVILHPSIETDRGIVEDRGRFVSEDIRRLASTVVRPA